MGIFNEVPKKQVIKDNYLLTPFERIHINLIRTKNYPISKLISPKIYPHINDFHASVNISSVSYNEKTYIDTLVKHIEIKPDTNSPAILLWSSLDYTGIIRNYTFSIIVYVRSDSTAIGCNLKIAANLPDQTVSKIIILNSGVNTASITFQNELPSLSINLRGSIANNIPTDGRIELLYYGIYYN